MKIKKKLAKQEKWGYNPYLVNLFEKYRENSQHIYDDYFTLVDFERGQKLNFFDEIKYLQENPDEEVRILRCRNTEEEVWISSEELIQIITNYMTANKVIGFKYDW